MRKISHLLNFCAYAGVQPHIFVEAPLDVPNHHRSHLKNSTLCSCLRLTIWVACLVMLFATLGINAYCCKQYQGLSQVIFELFVRGPRRYSIIHDFL